MEVICYHGDGSAVTLWRRRLNYCGQREGGNDGSGWFCWKHHGSDQELSVNAVADLFSAFLLSLMTLKHSQSSDIASCFKAVCFRQLLLVKSFQYLVFRAHNLATSFKITIHYSLKKGYSSPVLESYYSADIRFDPGVLEQRRMEKLQDCSSAGLDTGILDLSIN